MTPLPSPQAPQTVPTQQPQMAPSGPSMTPMGAPQGSSYQPMGGGDGVSVEAPRVLGTLSVDGVERALDSAAPGMQRCRVSVAQTVVVLAIVQPDGRVAITRAADENTGDPSVAQCVGNRFASQHVETGGGSGIVTFTTHLAAR